MSRKILQEWLAVAGVLLIGLCLIGIYRSSVVSCEKLRKAGFPESYIRPLAKLKQAHPRWKFIPLHVSDMPWDRIVDKECTPSWNLVGPHSSYRAENAKPYDSGAWYQASRAAIVHFMDPRNFLNESDVFMFESLVFDEQTQTIEVIERALSASFMARACYDGGTRRFSELLLEVGKALKVNPVFLAARLTSEQGRGSVQAQGRIGTSLVEMYVKGADRVGSAVVWGKTFAKNGTNTVAVVSAGREAYDGVYNFFNIGACGSGLFEIRYNAWREATDEKTCRRYFGPWTSQERAICGGALKIKERYVDSRRHTRYLQKFSVDPAAGSYRWKQYMQNIMAPLTESRNTRNSYAAAGMLEAPFQFVIPVYVQMPQMPQ